MYIQLDPLCVRYRVTTVLIRPPEFRSPYIVGPWVSVKFFHGLQSLGRIFHDNLI